MKRIRMPAGHSTSSQSIEEAFDCFLTDRAARGLAQKTLQTYKAHFHAISFHLDIHSSLGLLSRQQLNDMVVSMRSRGLTSNSICSYVRVMTTFLHWCQEEGLCQVSMPKYKAEETIKETYTDRELERLLERPSPSCRFSVYRTWVIVNFLLNSGCRAATLRFIQNRDVHLEHQQVISRHNKNGKVQVIPLCRQMVIILREYMEVRDGGAEDYLFCDEFGELLSENGLRLAIARYNKSRGVEKTSIHLFRHTFARKYLVDCGGDAFMLQKLLGHSTLKMTKHYCNIFDSDIARNYDQFSPLAQFNQPKARIHRT